MPSRILDFTEPRGIASSWAILGWESSRPKARARQACCAAGRRMSPSRTRARSWALSSRAVPVGRKTRGSSAPNASSRRMRALSRRRASSPRERAMFSSQARGDPAWGR